MKKVMYVLVATGLLVGLSGCGPIDNAKNISDKIMDQIEDTNEKIEENIEENIFNTNYSASELEDLIKEQPVYIYSSRYEVQDDDYKCLYPDLLIANIKNNSGVSIKNVTVAYVGWDSNNLPVKIYSGAADNYLVTVDFDDVNLLNGATYDDYGLSISCIHESNVAKFKALVISYEDFDGNKWENPLYENWQDLYVNKVLN